MPTAREVTDPHIGIYTSVPRPAPEICPICRRPRPEKYPLCTSCQTTIHAVSRPIKLVVPISLYLGLSQLHDVLRGYKDPEQLKLSDDQEKRFGLIVSATLARFLHLHKPCMEAAADTAWDTIVPVPSTQDRQGRHPLETALARVPSLSSFVNPVLAAGEVAITHNRPSDEGFRIKSLVKGQTILIVDDTFTSGASIQSAASVLSLAGANVAAALVLGRYVTLSQEFMPSRAWWNGHRESHPFTFDTCVVH